MASDDNSIAGWQKVLLALIAWLTLVTPLTFTTIQGCNHGTKLEQIQQRADENGNAIKEIKNK